ncbi:MAG: hypothetical protein RR681_02110, partial [Lachnospiraceae bacterium]
MGDSIFRGMTGESALSVPEQPSNQPTNEAGGRCTVTANMPILKRGMTGRAVRVWQSIIGVTLEGSFGPATERATVAWEQNNGISAPHNSVGQGAWNCGLNNL